MQRWNVKRVDPREARQAIERREATKTRAGNSADKRAGVAPKRLGETIKFPGYSPSVY